MFQVFQWPTPRPEIFRKTELRIDADDDCLKKWWSRNKTGLLIGKLRLLVDCLFVFLIGHFHFCQLLFKWNNFIPLGSRTTFETIFLPPLDVNLLQKHYLELSPTEVSSNQGFHFWSWSTSESLFEAKSDGQERPWIKVTKPRIWRDCRKPCCGESSLLRCQEHNSFV